MNWVWLALWYVIALPTIGIIFYYLNGHRVKNPDAEEMVFLVFIWVFSPIFIPIYVFCVCIKNIVMMGIEFPKLIEDIKEERKNKKETKAKSSWRNLFK